TENIWKHTPFLLWPDFDAAICARDPADDPAGRIAYLYHFSARGRGQRIAFGADRESRAGYGQLNLLATRNDMRGAQMPLAQGLAGSDRTGCHFPCRLLGIIEYILWQAY